MLLPEPDCPITPRNVPSATTRSRPCRARTGAPSPLNVFRRPRMSMKRAPALVAGHRDGGLAARLAGLGLGRVAALVMDVLHLSLHGWPGHSARSASVGSSLPACRAGYREARPPVTPARPIAASASSGAHVTGAPSREQGHGGVVAPCRRGSPAPRRGRGHDGLDQDEPRDVQAPEADGAEHADLVRPLAHGAHHRDEHDERLDGDHDADDGVAEALELVHGVQPALDDLLPGASPSRPAGRRPAAARPRRPAPRRSPRRSRRA